jgi:hypothetical protein
MADGAISATRGSEPVACGMARVLLEDPDLSSATPHRTLPVPGECDACGDGWAQLEDDVQRNGDYEHAVQAHISRHPNCTPGDLQSQLGCLEATLHVCLHVLVDCVQIQGVAPYACVASTEDDEWLTYRTKHLPLG